MTTTHRSVFTIRDYSGEQSTVNVYNGAITPASLPGFLTQFGALKSAIDAITLGVIAKEVWVGDDTTLSSGFPSNPFAQRELKWLVRYTGQTNGGIYTVTIPTADPTGRLLPNSDFADLTQTDMAALVTAFEAIARTPLSDTENVQVLSIELVGRNL